MTINQPTMTQKQKDKRIASLIQHLKEEIGNSGADLLDELIDLLTK